MECCILCASFHCRIVMQPLMETHREEPAWNRRHIDARIVTARPRTHRARGRCASASCAIGIIRKPGVRFVPTHRGVPRSPRNARIPHESRRHFMARHLLGLFGLERQICEERIHGASTKIRRAETSARTGDAAIDAGKQSGFGQRRSGEKS